MSVAHEQRVAAPEPGSDRAVVEAVRAGQVGQYALLYERYRAEALRIARRQVGPEEAQDLVQETFARVLRAIQNGGGPTEDVAGYIFRTLRNLRIDRGGQREFATDDVESAGPAGLWVVPDTSEDVLDRGLVADAFAELPPRWREVLWLTEVEGVGPSELSEKMGIKPTAVSTLSLRARAGFRSAWLQAHVRAGSAPSECRSVVTKLGDYQTGRLTTRRRAQVQEHLDHCDHCPAVVAELVAVSDHMGVLLLPVVVLAPKALWWLFGGWGVKAGFLLWGSKATLNRLRDPKVAVSSVGGAATVAVVTAVAMAMTAPPPPPPAADPTPAASAPASPSTAPSTSPSTSSGADADDTDDAAQPSPPQDQAPSDSPAAVPAPPTDAGAPAQPPAPAAEPDAPTSPAPGPDAADPPATTGAGPSDPPATTDPEPEDPAPEPAAPAPLEVSMGPVQGDLDGDALMLSGEGAVPGATITATDDDGVTVAEGTAAGDGSWQVRIGRPDSAATAAAGNRTGRTGGGPAAMGVSARSLVDIVAERDPADEHVPADEHGDDDEGSGDDDGAAPAQEYFYTLTQSVGSGVSADYAGQSEPLRVGPYTWVDPEPQEPVLSPAILSPESGESVHLVHVVDGVGSINVRFCRSLGRDMQLLLGETVIVTLPGWRIQSSDVHHHCWWGTYWVRGVSAGDQVISLRYVDDAGEVIGTPDTVEFRAELPSDDDLGETPQDEQESDESDESTVPEEADEAEQPDSGTEPTEPGNEPTGPDDGSEAADPVEDPEAADPVEDPEAADPIEGGEERPGGESSAEDAEVTGPESSSADADAIEETRPTGPDDDRADPATDND